MTTGREADSAELQGLQDYIDRFRNVRPDTMLKYLGELGDFLFANMTEAGRRYFLEKRRGERKKP